jgi:hypothetical protein
MFYWRGWGASHFPTNYQKWHNPDMSGLTYTVKYERLWEPFYCSLNATTPMHDVRFLQVHALR